MYNEQCAPSINTPQILLNVTGIGRSIILPVLSYIGHVKYKFTTDPTETISQRIVDENNSFSLISEVSNSRARYIKNHAQL